jgi:hypothetical protein
MTGTDGTATLECQGCGHVLAVPADLRDRALCACAHCGLILRNCAGSRAFRWAHVDPYVRRHGASRANLWGGLLGSLAWLPALAVSMALQQGFDLVALVILAVPYLLLLAVLRARRARSPAAVWMMELWAFLGAYLLYLAALGAAWPARFGGVFATGGLAPHAVGVLGALWLALGLAGRGWYRWRAARLPRLSGMAPAD